MQDHESLLGERQTRLRPLRQRRLTVQALQAYLHLAPTLAILAIFVFYPIINSFTLSLTRSAPFGGASIFVGLENYRRLLTELVERGDYYDRVRVSLLFAVGTVPTGIALAVALGILLSHAVKKVSWVYRLLIFMPIVISSAVTGVIFRWLYNPVVGYLNYWLGFVGIQEGPNWLAHKTWSLVAVIIAVVWRQLGFNSVVALAGVLNISPTYYEAARVDGASVWQRVWHITLPLLTPTIFFLLLTVTISSLQTFGEIHILTEGGPGQATTNMIYAIYRDAFVGTPYRGFASAQAYLLALLIVAISILNGALGKKVHYS
jgi:sn-glycerol 3-phosphate transport system permease protein